MKTGTEQKKKEEGVRFVRYFGPLLDALRVLGGSGTPGEVVERIAVDLGLSDDVQNETLSSGESRFAIRWRGRDSTSSGRDCLIPQNMESGASPNVVAQPSFRRKKHEKSFGSGFTFFRRSVVGKQARRNQVLRRWREKQR